MCERTCKFDAIHVVNNVAVIDYTKCRNCTMCAKACPKNAIEPIPTPEEKEKFKPAQKAMAEKKAAAAKMLPRLPPRRPRRLEEGRIRHSIAKRKGKPETVFLFFIINLSSQTVYTPPY